MYYKTDFTSNIQYSRKSVLSGNTWVTAVKKTCYPFDAKLDFTVEQLSENKNPPTALQNNLPHDKSNDRKKNINRSPYVEMETLDISDVNWF